MVQSLDADKPKSPINRYLQELKEKAFTHSFKLPSKMGPYSQFIIQPSN
jgi:hypothetical protein